MSGEHARYGGEARALKGTNMKGNGGRSLELETGMGE